MGCIVIAIVWRIAGVNAPIWYNATHYYANSSRNSSRLKSRRCDLTIRRASPPSMNKAAHSGFETQRIHHQSKTGVSVALKMDTCPPKFKKKTDDDRYHKIVMLSHGVNTSMFTLMGSDWSMMDDIITMNFHGKLANLDQKIILLRDHILKMLHYWHMRIMEELVI